MSDFTILVLAAACFGAGWVFTRRCLRLLPESGGRRQ